MSDPSRTTPRLRALLPLLWGLSGLLAACSGSSGSSSTPPGGGGFGAVVDDVLDYEFTGTKRLLFIVVDLQDRAPIFEASAAGEAQLVAVGETVRTACDRNSEGDLAIEFDYTWPPVPIAKSSTDYDPSDALVRIRADALEAARAAGWDPDQYDREVVFSPPVWNSAGRGWVRTIWMPHQLPFVLYHEIGHTMGWGHANFLDDDPLAVATPANDENYGDVYDPMGTGQMWTEFHRSGPWFQERAGWLEAGAVTEVTSPGEYALSDLEDWQPAVGPLALRIRRDADEDFWVFRRAGEPAVADGVLVVRVRQNPFEGSLLLDMHRGTAGAEEVSDAALLPGEVLDDGAHAGIVLENVTQPGGPPLVRVDLDSTRQDDLDRRPRIGVLFPPPDQGPISGVVEFEVTAADPDVGPRDGEGIAKVELELLEPVSDPFQVIAATELFERPWRWSFDTRTLRDAAYYLAITAEGEDGGRRTVWYRFLVDNATAGSS